MLLHLKQHQDMLQTGERKPVTDTMNVTWQLSRPVSLVNLLQSFPLSHMHAHAHRHKRQGKHRQHSLPRVLTLLPSCWHTPPLSLWWSSVVIHRSSWGTVKVPVVSRFSFFCSARSFVRTFTHTLRGMHIIVEVEQQSRKWILLPDGEEYRVFVDLCVCTFCVLFLTTSSLHWS